MLAMRAILPGSDAHEFGASVLPRPVGGPPDLHAPFYHSRQRRHALSHC